MRDITGIHVGESGVEFVGLGCYDVVFLQEAIDLRTHPWSTLDDERECGLLTRTMTAGSEVPEEARNIEHQFVVRPRAILKDIQLPLEEIQEPLEARMLDMPISCGAQHSGSTAIILQLCCSSSTALDVKGAFRI